jgi:hypothetical protein
LLAHRLKEIGRGLETRLTSDGVQDQRGACGRARELPFAGFVRG